MPVTQDLSELNKCGQMTFCSWKAGRDSLQCEDYMSDFRDIFSAMISYQNPLVTI